MFSHFIKSFIDDQHTLNAMQKIVGPSREVMVYGLSSCDWEGVTDEFKRLHYKVYDYENFPFATLPQDDDDISSTCKTTITSLILENARRIDRGLDIIPLVFVIANEQKKLSVSKVASTHGRKLGDITDQELRRCFKLYSETTPEIQNIVLQTIKFVKAKHESKFGFSFFTIVPLEPFWFDKEFKKSWRHRKHRKKLPKQFPWKLILTSHIEKLGMFAPKYNGMMDSHDLLEQSRELNQKTSLKS